MLNLGVLVLYFYQFSSISSYIYEEESIPTFLTASVGEYVVFNCEIQYPQDIPIPYVLKWKKDEKTIFSWDDGITTASDPFIGRMQLLNENIPEFGKASVNITSIRESDAGWFECKTVYPYRTPTTSGNGTWFYLSVNGGNLLLIPPINQTVMEGDDVHFTCITKEMGVKIRWFKDGNLLSELSNVFHRSRVDLEGSLTIHTTEMGDTGEYLCEAVNYLKESQSARAYLNVQFKAKVVYTPREIFLPFGQPAILDCNFKANPPLKSLRWEKDGFLFDPYNVPGVFYKQNGSLYFTKVDESHNGFYSCTPYNELGTEGPSPNIHVMVLRPPNFVTTPHHLYLRRVGEQIELMCDARDGESGHRPNIVWYKKDGTSLPDGRYTITDGILTITNIQEEDRGVYQCSATNEAATITAETELLIENATPRAPHNVTAKPSTNSVKLHWIPGRKRPRIKYSVWYREVEALDWRNVEIAQTFTLEATIYNLQSSREYEFMILSEDPHGEALFSKPIKVWTLNVNGIPAEVVQPSTSPISEPINVNAKLNNDGCLVTWEPPEHGSKYLKQYVLKWYETDTDIVYGTIETTNISYLVTNLEEGESYDFQVWAVTTDNYESASIKVTISIPAYKKIKFLSLSVTVAIGIIVGMGVVLYYFKNKCCRNKKEAD